MSIPQGLFFEPLVNQFQPGKLADLSAVSLVAGLTHKNLVRMRRDSNMRTDNYSSPKLDEIGSIPKSIRSSLNELIGYTKKSWSGWWLHHHETVFFKGQPADNLIDWFDLLVWLPDGTINCKQTARKLLNSDRLTKVQKFQLACAYCFIGDVERLKRKLTKNEMKKATDGRHKYCNHFLNYWSRRMNLEGRVDYENLLDEVISNLKHVSMYDLELYDEWPAIELFLVRIRNRHRTSIILDIIDLDVPNLTWLLLPALSDGELYFIFERKGFQIMKTLLKTHLYFDFAMSVWHKLVHIIDNNELVQIIHHVNGLDFERNDVNDLLWRMWLALSELQKDFIANKGISNFIECRIYINLDYYSPHFPLIIDVLSRSSQECRDLDWKKYWPYLVVGQLEHKKSIDYIMKLCLENYQQIQYFKKTTMTDYKSIRKYCNILVKQGRIKDVQTYVEFCTSDSQIIRNLMKTIIKGIPKNDLFDIFFHRRCDQTVADFNRYLEHIFTEDERKLYFDEMVTSRSNLKNMRDMLSLDLLKDLDDMVKFIETFVSSDESLIKAKLYFLENFKCRGCTSSVDLDLMAWCLNGDKCLVENIKKLVSAKDENFSSTDDVSEISSTDDDPEISTDEDESVPQKKRKLEPGHDVFNIFVDMYNAYYP